MLTLIAIVTALGGGAGISAVVSKFIDRRNENKKVELDERKIEIDEHGVTVADFQRIIDNLWSDNRTLREEIERLRTRLEYLEAKESRVQLNNE